MRGRTNEQWLADLRGPNPDEALADLYDLLVRGLRAGLGGYGGGVDASAEDFAQEALIKITGSLGSFRGDAGASASRFEEYAESRRRLDISAESVWFAPKPSGGGIAVVWLEAEDPERASRELVAELAAPETTFASWFGRQMCELFGCDFAHLPRAARSELLCAWREASGEGVR